MKKYFIRNEAGEQGPFSLEELMVMTITPETQIRHEDQDSWITAAQLEELKDLPGPAPEAAVPETTVTPAPEPVTETRVEETVVETAPVTVATAAVPAQVEKPAHKKGNPVITWVLSLALLGGTGYYIYQDIEKNREASPASGQADTDSPDPSAAGDTADLTNTPVTDITSEPVAPDTAGVTTLTTPETNPAPTTETSPDKTDAVNKADEEKKKAAAIALAKKKEEEKKKQLAAVAKKNEDDKKKQQAAQALAAREMEMRNNWMRYVTIGSFKLEGDDKVKPFTIPVNNGFQVPLEKLTLRVDYLKKEKIVYTENLTLYVVPAKGMATVQAAGNKKGHTANVYITGVRSYGLHFCYPSTGGKSGDPYYCN